MTTLTQEQRDEIQKRHEAYSAILSKGNAPRVESVLESHSDRAALLSDNEALRARIAAMEAAQQPVTDEKVREIEARHERQRATSSINSGTDWSDKDTLLRFIRQQPVSPRPVFGVCTQCDGVITNDGNCACVKALSTAPADTAALNDYDDEHPLVEHVARAIASNGFGRQWNDFLPINAFDTDQGDLKEYATAALNSVKHTLSRLPRTS